MIIANYTRDEFVTRNYQKFHMFNIEKNGQNSLNKNVPCNCAYLKQKKQLTLITYAVSTPENKQRPVKTAGSLCNPFVYLKYLPTVHM